MAASPLTAQTLLFKVLEPDTLAVKGRRLNG